MHVCEATIAVYEATEKNLYLERAKIITEVITASSKELNYQVREHYLPDWTPDLNVTKVIEQI